MPQGTGRVHAGREQQSPEGAAAEDRLPLRANRVDPGIDLGPVGEGGAGYLPEGFEEAAIGKSDPERIAGGDVRVFAVRVREEKSRRSPIGRRLDTRVGASCRSQVPLDPGGDLGPTDVLRALRRRHGRLVVSAAQKSVSDEAGWISRQGLTLAVDLTSGLNLYPDLRLVDNPEADYAASMDTVAELLAKMEILGSRHLILSLHRRPENNFTVEQTQSSFVLTLQAVCKRAATHQVTLHLRLVPGKPPWNVAEAVEFVDQVGAANLHLAPSTGVLLAQDADAQTLRGKVGLWLLSGSRTDVAGELWDVHAPVAEVQQKDKITNYVSVAPTARFVLDAIYSSQDDEYRDACAWKRFCRLPETRSDERADARQNLSRCEVAAEYFDPPG